MANLKDTAVFSDSTFGNQKVLPKLPVPDLEETCSRYLEWIGPLLDPEGMERTARVTRAFCSPEGDGPVLQAALADLASRKDTANWLEPFWDRMYLSGRSPLPLYSNIFYMLSRIPLKEGESQFDRAARLVGGALRFKGVIARQELKPDSDGKRPLCMIQYRKLFSSCRIPHKGSDTLRTPVSREDPTSPEERHIVVARNGRFFALDVIDHEGAPLPDEAIGSALREIVEYQGGPGEPVGFLTAVSRDLWAEGRALLRAIPGENIDILESIERALFLLCLEERQPENMEELSRTMILGDGMSRWFDKGMQFIVCPDGTTAINMEHTGTDGSVMVRLASSLINDPGVQKGSAGSDECTWEELRFRTDPAIDEMIKKASYECKRMYEDTSARVLVFDRFGKEGIKSLSVAPDAFIQMALQLAHFDLRGYAVNTYEAVMTRQFLHGRTEAVRPVSWESVKFTSLMRDDSATSGEKADAARKAIEEQVSRTREAREGLGVDRHLFGLYNIFLDMGKDLGIEELPEFFRDPGWLTLKRNLLSTSTSGTGGLFLAGFGTVDDEGFGVRYLTFPGSIHFNVTSRTILRQDMDKFVDLLESALLEMEELLRNRES
jgi:carnitine O-acetyltransferase